MPKNRPGRIKYVTATKTTTHGQACVESNIAGVAVRQVSPHWSDAYSSVTTIAIGEKFAIINKGIVEVPNTPISAAVKGDPIYIVAATNALTTTVGTNPKFGRVAEVASERGGRAGYVRIDLDSKDSF
jgi:predicted RecA/RadA family phage recombinase